MVFVKKVNKFRDTFTGVESSKTVCRDHFSSAFCGCFRSHASFEKTREDAVDAYIATAMTSRKITSKSQ